MGEGDKPPPKESGGGEEKPKIPDYSEDIPEGLQDDKWNCAGFAFRTYNALSLEQTKARLAKCTEQKDCADKCLCGQIKCWLWEYKIINEYGEEFVRVSDPVLKDPKTTKEMRDLLNKKRAEEPPSVSEFHIVCAQVPGDDPTKPGENPGRCRHKAGATPPGESTIAGAAPVENEKKLHITTPAGKKYYKYQKIDEGFPKCYCCNVGDVVGKQ